MRVLDIIVCDDVRRELGDKFSLMGVYADEIRLEVVPEGPYALRLALFVRTMLDAGDQDPDRVEFTIRLGEHEVAQGGGPIAISEPGRPINLVFGLNPIVLPALGEASFELKLTCAGAAVGAPIRHRINVVGGQATAIAPVVQH